MTQHVLEVHKLNDPRVTDEDIAAAVREIGFNKPVRDDNTTYSMEEVMDIIVEKALIHSAKRETA
ncbi:hypothetical protein CPT_Piffle_048 [Stenotrophomonas phage Piffle]|uniref:Uncharacterized protein n=1 Tax=Stenotrophomonas phage Piffle TaxID=2859656 RepID=A0AAE8BI53_9CAUD|nr:hypothetical protein PP762_gp84 [Stenotrophomonas phage Piffle]QYW01902.1 hypothetical protein CPT_Piffle_048 [Stenotrophomonas phage Piffle]